MVDFRKVIRQHPFLEFIHRRGFPLYWVGGGVRDWLLFQEYPRDWDFTTPEDPRSIGEALAREGWGRVVQTSPLGTVKIVGDVGEIDVARFRKETYPHPGALPQVTFTRSLEEDLWRRDFTVNAMAVSLTGSDWGTLWDPSGGLEDLARRRLHPLHPHSFRDDPTRMFRGIRYAVRLGFRLSASFYRQLREYRGVLDRVSFARIRREWMRMVQEERRRDMVRRVARWGLRVPAVSVPAPLLRCVDRLAPRTESAWIWFFMLIWKSARKEPPALEHLTREERRRLEGLKVLLRVRTPEAFAGFLLRQPEETWALWGCLLEWPRPDQLRRWVPPPGRVWIAQGIPPQQVTRARMEWLAARLRRRWPFREKGRGSSSG